MRGSGGSDGGVGIFLLGLGLAGLAIYLFLDSVMVTSGSGWISGAFGAGGWGTTTSTGVIFVPFVLGVISLFYDASKTWAWVLFLLGLAVIIVEILSRLHFAMQMKTSHLLLIMGMFAAGIGLILRSFKEDQPPSSPNEKPASGDGVS